MPTASGGLLGPPRVDMKGLSDHHTVVVRLDRETLTKIPNH